MKKAIFVLSAISLFAVGCKTFQPACHVQISTNPPSVTFKCDSLFNALLKNGGTITIPPVDIPIGGKRALDLGVDVQVDVK